MAVVDTVATAPVNYYVHTGHHFRPIVMTNASKGVAWIAIYNPFRAVAGINALSTTMDLRFPGQWFQLETDLQYNWHRHYDATTGRYLQPDPLIVDDGAASISGCRRNLCFDFGAIGPLGAAATQGIGAHDALLHRTQPGRPHARDDGPVRGGGAPVGFGGFSGGIRLGLDGSSSDGVGFRPGASELAGAHNSSAGFFDGGGAQMVNSGRKRRHCHENITLRTDQNPLGRAVKPVYWPIIPEWISSVKSLARIE